MNFFEKALNGFLAFVAIGSIVAFGVFITKMPIVIL